MPHKRAKSRVSAHLFSAASGLSSSAGVRQDLEHNPETNVSFARRWETLTTAEKKTSDNESQMWDEGAEPGLSCRKWKDASFSLGSISLFLSSCLKPKTTEMNARRVCNPLWSFTALVGSRVRCQRSVQWTDFTFFCFF